MSSSMKLPAKYVYFGMSQLFIVCGESIDQDVC
jgi:hypothetical protein